MKVVLALVAIVVAVPARAQQITRFDRAGTSYQTYLQDRYGCIQGSAQTVYRGSVGSYSFGNGPQIMGRSVGGIVYSRSVFVACMNAKGYNVNDNGKFGPPPGGVVRMGP